MLNRRVFLEAGLAASALPLLARAGPIAAVDAPVPQPPLSLYRTIADERFQAGRGFATVAARSGAVVLGTSGDITDLWYEDLAPRWREQPAAIAGLTAADALFCLERLAWDAGLRVVYLGEHRELTDGSLRHRLWGPAPMNAAADALASAAQDWHERVGDLVRNCPARGTIPVTTRNVLCDARLRASAEPLYSWVIAPAVNRGAKQ